MRIILCAVLFVLPVTAWAEENEEKPWVAYGPLASFAISINYAIEGEWDKHFSFSLHSEDLKVVNELRQEQGEEFLKMYEERKIPQQLEMFRQAQLIQIPVFQMNGESVAFIRLAEPIRSTQGLLMFKEGHHFVFRNSSNVNAERLPAIEEAMAASGDKKAE